MAKVLRNWTKKNTQERVDFGLGVKDALANNPLLPATHADYVAYVAAFDALDAAHDVVTALENQLRTARLARAGKMDLWLGATEELATTVDSVAKGDAAKISTTGYDPTDGVIKAPQPVGQVVNFSVTAGDNDGELDCQHDRVTGAVNYETQTTTNPMDGGVWVNQPPSTRTSYTITGLPSGSRQWVRRRAVGTLGPGPWSDAGTKIVP